MLYHTSFPVGLLLVTALMLKLSSSHPMKPYKVMDPIPLLVLSSLPREVDEPTNTIENLPGSGDPRDPSYGDGDYDTDTDSKPKPGKRTGNGIFQDNSNSCCPTVVEIIEPLGGKNRSGALVELYQGDDGVRQRFYEVSCDPDFANQHCQFLDRRHTPHSKCVQQYSYTYALVRDFGIDYDEVANGGWRLDYIQVRSGCSCKIMPRHSGGHHSS